MLGGNLSLKEQAWMHAIEITNTKMAGYAPVGVEIGRHRATRALLGAGWSVDRDDEHVFLIC